MLKINRLLGSPAVDYQVNFTVPGNSFARSYTRDGLHDFLITGTAFDEDRVETLFDDLIAHGNALVDEVEIPEQELGILGFERIPSDV